MLAPKYLFKTPVRSYISNRLVQAQIPRHSLTTRGLGAMVGDAYGVGSKAGRLFAQFEHIIMDSIHKVDVKELDLSGTSDKLVNTDREFGIPEFTPYAVQSLNDAILQISSDVLFSNLLSEDDRKFLVDFQRIKEAQLLSTRLFGRVQTFFEKDDFQKLVDNVPVDKILKELVAAGFLSTSMCQSLITLFFSGLDGVPSSELITSLSRQKLEQLASKYNIKDWKKMKVPQLVVALQKTASVSPLGAFFGKQIDTESLFRSQISRVLGTCWRPERARMRLLAGIIWLSSLGSDTAMPGPTRAKSVEAHLKTELYNMLLVRRKDIIYPAYEIKRTTGIYRTPKELHLHLDLLDTELRLEALITNKEYSSAIDIYDSMKPRLRDLLINPVHTREDIPEFLRRFTAPYRALRILFMVVDLFERQRRYTDAVALIHWLLSLPNKSPDRCPLDSVGPCRAGRLIIRLLIDQGTHIKQPLETLKVILGFMKLEDKRMDASRACTCLRGGLRLTVQEQMNKLAVSVSSSENGELDTVSQPKRRRLKKDNELLGSGTELPQRTASCQRWSIPQLVTDLRMAPEVNVSAPVNASSKDIGAHRPHYLWIETASPKKSTCSPNKVGSPTKRPLEQHTLLLNVEQWTLRHYTSRLGFERGIHAESSIHHLLFTLLFYDILFDHSLPDVFYSYRQAAPLDLFSDDFYRSRKVAIDARLEEIENVALPMELHSPDMNPVTQRINNCWTDHYGERCLWINWELFKKPDEVSELFWCLGPKVVHTVCRQLAMDFRTWKSGLPDLVVWTPRERRAKLVEVKGPGDQLSAQQIMWLDILVRAGADVEICHVSAVSHRSLVF
ncbi:Fanconi-associated nuclease 1 [Clonorchis sinensis]|uniref:Fanconi-associated nuclease n=1 Tax=Clonorchis sinensis TaxID=79923 RepID=A0A8T1M899_CLOSI|nr:Fanconi-associated nuclease 1 [Clonorchis sinensis]